MERACDGCGRPYEAKRKTSRFCSDLCRARNKGASGEPEAPSLNGHVAASTRAMLEKAERVETPLGASALLLASRIDSAQDTGSALAALNKEWRATLAQATDGVKMAASPLDELKARREARRGA